jgi:glycosyltransferase involved in cell wall biosynthesis
MKIIYLTWGETPRSYGIFGSQVIGQFVASKQLKADSAEFNFISAVPIVHSGFVREKLNYFNEIKKVRKLLNQIPFSIIPIYAPQNFVNSTKITFPLMHFGAHWHLGKKLQSLSPDIVHCRSYHAAWAALSVKEKLNLNYKIVFDARSLWPEEMALKKKWDINDKNFHFLKNIEEKLITESDVTVSVSEPMAEHYVNLGAKKVETICLSASVKKLDHQNNNQNKNTTTLCYIGALAKNSWHEPKYLVELYMKFRSCVANPNLIVVTTSNHKILRHDLSSIPADELNLTMSKTIEELAEILSHVDFGALPYRQANKGYEEIIAKTVLATKTVEYLSAGLPVLVNRQCEGAASLINKYDVGIAYDPLNLEAICQDNLNSYKNVKTTENAKKLAKDLFDYEANAERYCNLYDSLL